ncbi:hypothetical protein ACER0C_001335 [Sarotherodon galilaeus]
MVRSRPWTSVKRFLSVSNGVDCKKFFARIHLSTSEQRDYTHIKHAFHCHRSVTPLLLHQGPNRAPYLVGSQGALY